MHLGGLVGWLRAVRGSQAVAHAAQFRLCVYQRSGAAAMPISISPMLVVRLVMPREARPMRRLPLAVFAVTSPSARSTEMAPLLALS